MKKIIGIISNTVKFTEDPFLNRYYTLDTFVSKIKEIGGIPIIIPPVNLVLNEEAMDLCDAFLIPGGCLVKDYHLDVVDYVLKHKKKLLGICMGMQVIGMYANKDNKEKTLEEIKNHYVDEGITVLNKEVLVHDIVISKDSKLYQILKIDKMTVNSIHHYALKYVSKPFKVVAKDNDIIEAIEYENIIVVQFHPELLHSCNKLFKWLVS